MATVKSGFLEKLSGARMKDWKRRYFVLYQNGLLVKYVRQVARQSSGIRINVRTDCQKIDYGSEVEKDAQQKCADRVGCLFSIKTIRRTIFLLAESVQDALDWVAKFNGIRQNTVLKASYGAPGLNQSGIPLGLPLPKLQPEMSYPPNDLRFLLSPNQPGTYVPVVQQQQVSLPYSSRRRRRQLVEFCGGYGGRYGGGYGGDGGGGCGGDGGGGCGGDGGGGC